jgi:phytoene desaturase
MLFAPATPRTAALRSDRRPHAVVIGSGFGGLAAAIRLGARGYRVTILERLEQPGGRACVHRQDGFTFDAGPTIITAPFVFEELWKLAGGDFRADVDLRALDPFYRIRFNDGETFDAGPDMEAMCREVGRLSPGDVAGYRRFMADSEKVYRVAFEQLGHIPFSSLLDMAKVTPVLLRLGGLSSVHGKVASYVRDERLRMALSFHPLFMGGHPFRATAIYTLIAWLEHRHGVHWVMGGTGALVTAMVRLAERVGATLRLNSDVAEILVRDGAARGVRMADGQEIKADIVVSNADSATTYGKLVPAASRGRWSGGKLGRARYSMSLFVWYFGTRRRYENVPHHMILMGPRYRELLDDIFLKHRLSEDFSLYLHRPTATDPSLAPAGCDAFYALSPVPNLDGDTDWRTMAEPYRRRIEAHLERTVLPGLSGEVVTSRLMTPLDFEDRLQSFKGAAFGLEPILTQSAWFRPHNRSESIDRLYLVGAGTHPGAGVPGVVSSARVLDTLVPDVHARA